MTDTPAPALEAEPQTVATADAKAGRPRRAAWIVFAGGLESYNVPIIYVLFGAYFVNAVAPSPVEGQQLLNYTQSIFGAIAALLVIPLAFAAENPRLRRALMALFVLLNAGAATVFWMAAPGSPMGVLLTVMAAFGVAAVSNDLLYVFYGSMLPEVAPPSILGRTSGLSTAIGWALAIAATAVFLVVFVFRETPPFGLDPDAGEPQRLLGVFAAGMMLLLCAPLLLFPAPATTDRPRRSLRQWFDEEIRSLLTERAAAMAVLARLVFWSGVVLIMLNGSPVAASIMGWGALGASAFGLIVLVAGAVGAGLGGVLDDKLGTRVALSLMLLGLGVSLSLVLTMSPDKAFALFPLEPRAEGARDLSSTAEYIVLGLGALTGLFLGTAGPMSRSLIARYAPPERTARYFGLAALAGNATSIVGPLFVALVTSATNSQRAGLLVSPVFLILGIFILRLLPKSGYR
jgi:UMF1 family MFS transporter